MASTLTRSVPAPTARRKLPLAVLILTAGLIAALLAYLLSSGQTAEFDPLDENVTLAYGPAGFNDALAVADERVALNQERVARDPQAWSYHENLSLAYLVRAQLTGSFDDLLASSQAMAKSLKLAPDRAGPGLSSAVVNMALHRLDEAEQGIDLVSGFAVSPLRDDLAEIEALKGDLQFYRGDYTGAYHSYAPALQQRKAAVTTFRLASWHKFRGEFDQAIALYVDGSKTPGSRTPQRFAVYLLQIGALELQRGNWVLARQYFERANGVFPGYWLAEAHVAQMDAAEGDFAAAENQYLEIIGRTGNPDVMAALIGLYENQGRTGDAQKWSTRAGKIWQQRVSRLPETYYDHAFDHMLSTGDIGKALTFARNNFAVRPYGDAAIGLARALTANGEPSKAIALLESQEQAGWRSVELYAAMVETYEAANLNEKARQSKKKALAINPRAFEEAAELLAFGNH